MCPETSGVNEQLETDFHETMVDAVLHKAYIAVHITDLEIIEKFPAEFRYFVIGQQCALK